MYKYCVLMCLSEHITKVYIYPSYLHIYLYSHIFYRKITSDSAKEWIQRLKEHDVPVIVCMTFADELYTEAMKEEQDKNPNPTDFKIRCIRKELEVNIK